MEKLREQIKDKKRIVIKIGSSSLVHKETGGLDYTRLDVLCQEIADLRNQGKDIILVSSGAIAVGKRAFCHDIDFKIKPAMGFKQACAAVGQARLMMVYQKIFAEYNQIAAQILMTKNTILDPVNRENAYNTFTELVNLGAIPIVNENDTVSTSEILVDEDDILIGDNDTLSAIVASLVHADLLILLTDIDGLYTDDPRVNKEAKFIEEVEELTDEYMHMGKGSTGSNVGTGGMNTKMNAAKIATCTGTDMIIANSKDIRIIHRLMDGRNYGTLFKAHKDPSFDVISYVQNLNK